MAMETVLFPVLAGIGIGLLTVSVLALAHKKITETLSLIWGLFAFLLLLAGFFAGRLERAGYLSSRGVLFSLYGIPGIVLAACFISARISCLICRMREASMQISLIKLEEEISGKETERGERKKLLLIMPAYNEEKNIRRLLYQIEEAKVRRFADILVIDDASSDRTARIAEGMGCLCVKCILHQGYAGALRTGYKYAVDKGYSYVIQLDADGQHDVCNIEVLYRALCTKEDGQMPDIVLGSRFLPGSRSFSIPAAKMFAINIFRMILRMITGQQITDPTTGLQGLSARVISFYACHGGFNSVYPDANTILQMLLRGYRVREVPAVMHARKEGKSIHTGLKPFVYMLRMIFSISAVYIRERLFRSCAE